MAIFKKIILKIDDRRESLEDFIADKILANLDENETVDNLERKGIIAGITAASTPRHTAFRLSRTK